MITLGWFGVKSAQDQREIHKHRIIALITQNLARLDENISELVKSYERKLNTLDSMTDYSTPSLRKLVRSIPVVHQLLILDQRGKRIFPSRVSFTRPEHDFIRRTKPFIETFLKGNRRGKKDHRNRQYWRQKTVTSSKKLSVKKNKHYRPNSRDKSRQRTLTKKENGNIRIEQHLYANTSPASKSSKLVATKIARQKRSSNAIQNTASATKPRVLALNSSASMEPQFKEAPRKTEINKLSTKPHRQSNHSPISQYDTSSALAKSAPTSKQDDSSNKKKLVKKYQPRVKIIPPSHFNALKKPVSNRQSIVVSNSQRKNKSQANEPQPHSLRPHFDNFNKNTRKNTSSTHTQDLKKFEQARNNKNSHAALRMPSQASTKRRYTAPSARQNLTASPTKRQPSSHSTHNLSAGIYQQQSIRNKERRTRTSKPELSVKPPLQTQQKESVFQDLRGWSIGFRKNGINLIFSFRKSDGYLIAAEISRTQLIADITLLSPISKSQTNNSTQSRITLTNARGDVISQWGRYEPEKNSKPLVSYGLAVPLNSWKLNYFSAKIDLDNSYSYAPFVLGVSAVFIAVFGLAFYFYRESNRELTVASQRVTFVNQVSHELKTPLTNIRMYAELLEEDLEDTNDKTRSRMQVIINESQRLSRMIINVLNFARHQRKQLTIIRSMRIVDDIIRHVLDQLRPALQRLNIEVEFKANASQEINIDTDILEQILHNLISNVEKYAATGQYLGIESNIINGTVQLILSDKGPGIPRPMVHKIFEAFYRGNNQLAEGVSGTGIGLSISRELARLHGGDLELVNSQQGITFKLTLDSKAKRK